MEQKENNSSLLYILDYNSSTLHKFHIGNRLIKELKFNDNISDLIKALGFNEDEVYYIWPDGDLDIYEHIGTITELNYD